MARSISLLIVNKSGEKTSEKVVLPSNIFGLSIAKSVIAQYVRMIIANRKRNVNVLKTRSEITGSTKKMYRQKGTGRARHSTSKAPIFVGGGSAHGPKNISRKLRMPQKMRRKALFSVLSQMVQNKHMVVVKDSAIDKLVKTSDAVNLMNTIGKDQKILFVFPHKHKAKQGVRNIVKVTPTEIDGLNAYVVLNHNIIVWTQKSIQSFITRNIEKKS